MTLQNNNNSSKNQNVEHAYHLTQKVTDYDFEYMPLIETVKKVNGCIVCKKYGLNE